LKSDGFVSNILVFQGLSASGITKFKPGKTHIQEIVKKEQAIDGNKT